MKNSNKFLSAMTLFIVLGATLAFMVNKNQPGNLYYYVGTGCGGGCAVAPCETTNNSSNPCGIFPLFTDEFCSTQYTGAAWWTTNGK